MPLFQKKKKKKKHARPISLNKDNFRNLNNNTVSSLPKKLSECLHEVNYLSSCFNDVEDEALKSLVDRVILAFSTGRKNCPTFLKRSNNYGYPSSTTNRVTSRALKCKISHFNAWEWGGYVTRKVHCYKDGGPLV